MLVHQHFYQLNSGRKYPIASVATGEADKSQTPLPNDLIVDANLQFPATLGTTPYLSSISVTPALVTLTLQCHGNGNFQPLAVLSVPQPVIAGRVYPLVPQADGVGGYVVFGTGVASRNLSLRFSSPEQAALEPKTYRTYEPLPIPSIGKLNNSVGLQGVVALKARDPLEVVREALAIDGAVRDAIVVRMKASPDQAELLTQFAGECGRRPESYSCGDPEPIERIATVEPDCNGELTLEFSGCADLMPLQNGHGFVLSCGIGLSNVCRDPLPDSLGIYDTHQSECVYDWFPDEGESDSDSESDPEPEESDSDSESDPLTLPYLECFDDQNANSFSIPSGQFVFAADSSPADPCGEEGWSFASEGAESAGSRNIAVLARPIDTTLGKTITADIKLQDSPNAHNAGLLFNYQPHLVLAGRYTWFVAEIDYDSLEFRLSRFNGSQLLPLVSTNLPTLKLDEWYRITVQIASHITADASLTATLELASTLDQLSQLGPVLTNNYFPADGFAGFHANRSLARFSFLQVGDT